MNRRIAHFAAHDLVAAIIRQDECKVELLAEMRAKDVEDALSEVARRLGYTIAPAQKLEAAE